MFHYSTVESTSHAIPQMSMHPNESPLLSGMPFGHAMTSNHGHGPGPGHQKSRSMASSSSTPTTALFTHAPHESLTQSAMGHSSSMTAAAAGLLHLSPNPGSPRVPSVQVTHPTPTKARMGGPSRSGGSDSMSGDGSPRSKGRGTLEVSVHDGEVETSEQERRRKEKEAMDEARLLRKREQTRIRQRRKRERDKLSKQLEKATQMGESSMIPPPMSQGFGANTTARQIGSTTSLDALTSSSSTTYSSLPTTSYLNLSPNSWNMSTSTSVSGQSSPGVPFSPATLSTPGVGYDGWGDHKMPATSTPAMGPVRAGGATTVRTKGRAASTSTALSLTSSVLTRRSSQDRDNADAVPLVPPEPHSKRRRSEPEPDFRPGEKGSSSGGGVGLGVMIGTTPMGGGDSKLSRPLTRRTASEPEGFSVKSEHAIMESPPRSPTPPPVPQLPQEYRRGPPPPIMTRAGGSGGQGSISAPPVHVPSRETGSSSPDKGGPTQNAIYFAMSLVMAVTRNENVSNALRSELGIDGEMLGRMQNDLAAVYDKWQITAGMGRVSLRDNTPSMTSGLSTSSSSSSVTAMTMNDVSTFVQGSQVASMSSMTMAGTSEPTSPVVSTTLPANAFTTPAPARTTASRPASRPEPHLVDSPSAYDSPVPPLLHDRSHMRAVGRPPAINTSISAAPNSGPGTGGQGAVSAASVAAHAAMMGDRAMAAAGMMPETPVSKSFAATQAVGPAAGAGGGGGGGGGGAGGHGGNGNGASDTDSPANAALQTPSTGQGMFPPHLQDGAQQQPWMVATAPQPSRVFDGWHNTPSSSTGAGASGHTHGHLSSPLPVLSRKEPFQQPFIQHGQGHAQLGHQQQHAQGQPPHSTMPHPPSTPSHAQGHHGAHSSGPSGLASGSGSAGTGVGSGSAAAAAGFMFNPNPFDTPSVARAAPQQISFTPTTPVVRHGTDYSGTGQPAMYSQHFHNIGHPDHAHGHAGHGQEGVPPHSHASGHEHQMGHPQHHQQPHQHQPHQHQPHQHQPHQHQPHQHGQLTMMSADANGSPFLSRHY